MLWLTCLSRYYVLATRHVERVGNVLDVEDAPCEVPENLTILRYSLQHSTHNLFTGVLFLAIYMS